MLLLEQITELERVRTQIEQASASAIQVESAVGMVAEILRDLVQALNGKDPTSGATERASSA